MNAKEIEAILKLMNRYGCTKLSTASAIFEIPNPAKPLVDDLLNITDEDMQQVEVKKSEIDKLVNLKPLSQDEIDDDILFAHEEFEDGI